VNSERFPGMKPLAFTATLLTSLSLWACASRPQLATVPFVDLNRYAGKWHEIAKYPNWFERGCMGSAIAEYTPQRGGSIKVVNSCPRKNGSAKTVVGRATVVPKSGNARLKVRFFGPLAGDYWIIGLDEKNYSWALVGHPSRRFLWILSRQPSIKEDLYRQIVGIAVRQGFHAERIVPSLFSISL
jgi:apolipoprotein D and lipocalin family protein